MEVKRVISTGFWNDDLVLGEFTAEDKYFMLYLLCNPHTTQLGIYHLPIKLAAVEMGYSEETIRNLLDRFENTYHLIRYSKDTNEIAIKNYLKHSIVKGGKPVMDLLLKEEDAVHDRSLLEYISNHLSKEIEQKRIKNSTVINYVNHLINTVEIINNYTSINNISINDNDNEESYPHSYHESYHDSYNDSYHDSSETKKSKSKSKETSVDIYNRVKGEFDLGNEAEEMLLEWYKYKDEIRKPLKERSIRTELKSVGNYIYTFGIAKVKQCYQSSISNGWQGVFLNRLGIPKTRPIPKKVEPEKEEEEIEETESEWYARMRKEAKEEGYEVDENV